MSSPEHRDPNEKRRNLHVKLMDLTREMILEGMIDPTQGTQFALVQADHDKPFTELTEIAENGSLVVVVGIPNPLEYEFDKIIKGQEE